MRPRAGDQWQVNGSVCLQDDLIALNMKRGECNGKVLELT